LRERAVEAQVAVLTSDFQFRKLEAGIEAESCFLLQVSKMASVQHNLKKRMSKATTRSKTIESSISAPYAAEKKALLRQKKALQKLLRLNDSAREKWMDVFKLQKDFSEHILLEADFTGDIRSTAEEATSSLRSLETSFFKKKDSSEKSSRIEGHVRSYVAEIEAIEKEFKDVETSFTEVQRYEKKVGKLAEKATKGEKTNRNMEKLQSSRAIYQSKVDGMGMKITNNKFEAILQCGLHAFWLEQDKYMALINAQTGDVREIAKRLEDALVTVDVSRKGLEPILSSSAPTLRSSSAASSTAAKVGSA